VKTVVLSRRFGRLMSYTKERHKMYIDPIKMKSARERHALTQENLAHQSRVNVRTIQRAESGYPIRSETLQDIAAVLGMPPAGLMRRGPVKEDEVFSTDLVESSGPTHVLKRVESGEFIVSTLERSVMSVLGCTAEPNAETMPALTELITQLERIISNPWDEHEPNPLRFSSLLDRLAAVASLNSALAAIEKQGMALYMAASTEYVKVPRRTDEGMATFRTQCPEYATAVRFMISEYSAERLRLPADVIWPLEIEDDVDVPF
jgi:transcriptional regulator with XRE-family HTH domain